MTERMDLSVVIPSVNGLPIVLECLNALRADAASGVAIEMLVVDRCGEDVRRALRDRFPEATIVPTARDATIPEMRALAFRHARADAIAVIEDHVLVPSGWARQMLEALAAGHDVVGGIVLNAATERLVDWAAFLCEYSHLLPPIPAGEAEWLTGNNVVYRKAVLEKYQATLAEGRWEDYLHAAMRRGGVALFCRPDIVVGHKMHYRVRDYLSQRYLYARGCAGQQRTAMSTAARAVKAVGTLTLPPVLLFRIVSRVLASSSHRAELARSMPLLGVFVCAWAFGEMVGYVAGPGDTMGRIS
ncbi:MAG TPA: glycosyltransferase [Vicinamibacterales bacterium]|nr:glycosyltransferase [Vicinamibacterales bacterium]